MEYIEFRGILAVKLRKEDNDAILVIVFNFKLPRFKLLQKITFTDSPFKDTVIG